MLLEQLVGILPPDKAYNLVDGKTSKTLYRGGLSDMEKEDFEYGKREVGIIHDFDYQEMIIYLERE
jgi:hypothetical protein